MSHPNKEIEDANAYYDELGTQSDLREPHRIPQQFFRGLFEKEIPTLPPAPVIAFINSRSGGHAGPELSVALRRALGSTQVFDLSKHAPDKVLRQLWDNFTDGGTSDADHLRTSLRILTAGGDGTVAWVLQTIARLDLQPAPAVAVIPLGTGNDLSRSFGWGPAFTKAWIKGHTALHKTLGRVAKATPTPLDRWRVCMTAPSPKYFAGKRPYGFVAEDSATEASSYSAEAWNYISVGMDAKAAKGFHHLRDTKPSLAFSRTANQFWYGYFSCSSGWFCGAEPLSRTLKLEVLRAGQWEEVEISAAVRAVVLLNLQSYGGGRNLWGKHSDEAAEKGFTQPSSCDGLLEVVAFKSGYHAGVVMAGGMHAVRLAQAAGVRMRVRGTEAAKGEGEGMGAAYIQLDGEPWKQNVPGKKSPESEALQVEVTHQGQSCMLLSPGFKGSAPPPSNANKATGTSLHHPAVQSTTAEGATVESSERGASMGLSQVPNSIGATVSMPHVDITEPDTALGGVPMPPAPAQNLHPELQSSGPLPQPTSPITSHDLSALAAAGGSPPNTKPNTHLAPNPNDTPSTTTSAALTTTSAALVDSCISDPAAVHIPPMPPVDTTSSNPSYIPTMQSDSEGSEGRDPPQQENPPTIVSVEQDPDTTADQEADGSSSRYLDALPLSEPEDDIEPSRSSEYIPPPELHRMH